MRSIFPVDVFLPPSMGVSIPIGSPLRMMLRAARHGKSGIGRAVKWVLQSVIRVSRRRPKCVIFAAGTTLTTGRGDFAGRKERRPRRLHGRTQIHLVPFGTSTPERALRVSARAALSPCSVARRADGGCGRRYFRAKVVRIPTIIISLPSINMKFYY